MIDDTGDAARTSLGHDDLGHSCLLGVGEQFRKPDAGRGAVDWVGRRGHSESAYVEKEWAYHSGVGSAFVGVATNVGQTKMRAYVQKGGS